MIAGGGVSATMMSVVNPVAPAAREGAGSGRANPFTAMAASLLLPLIPRWAGKQVRRVPLGTAIGVAVVHIGLGFMWIWVAAGCVEMWQTLSARGEEGSGGALSAGGKLHLLGSMMGAIRMLVRDAWRTMAIGDRFATVTGTVLGVAAMVAVGGFMLLPFAARTGSNRACAMHVSKLSLLGTGFVHVWGVVLSAMFLFFYVHQWSPAVEDFLSPVLGVLSGLLLYTLLWMIRAARVEYRRAADMPVEREPLCDNCGYNLTLAPLQGQCPECGRAVAASLGEQTRPGTPWERRREMGTRKAVRMQLRGLVAAPRQLLFQSPALSGQRDSQRWLAGWLVIIALSSAWVMPAFVMTGQTLVWSWLVLWGGVALAVVWGGMALMMVGIETAGLAIFSRMRGNPIPLASAAKVTGFAVPLMLVWVFMAGVQLLASQFYEDHLRSLHSMRTEQVFLAVSLGIAHIGGLLWFEFTVYRGVRAIHYANK